MNDFQLMITGLSSLDQEESAEAIGDDSVQFSRPDVPEGTLAEPATISAVIALGTIALNGLVVWLSKARRKHTSAFRYRLVRPNGEVVEIALDLNDASEGAVKSQILDAIGRSTSTAAATPES